MKAVVFHGVNHLRVDNVERPTIECPTDVIVKTIAASLCGSDLHPLHGAKPCDVGTIFGHELVGTVVEVGTAVSALQIGARVMCPFSTACGACPACKSGLSARCESGQLLGFKKDGRGLHGAQAEYVRVPLADSTLVNLGDEHVENGLLLADIAGTAVFCAANALFAGPPTDSLRELLSTSAAAGSGTKSTHDAIAQSQPLVYVVLGCGPVGLLSLIALRHLLHLQGVEAVEPSTTSPWHSAPGGRALVFAIDSVPERLRTAEDCGGIPIHLNAAAGPADITASITARIASMGFTLALPVKAGLASAVLECVGAPAAISLAFSLVRPGGTLASVGIPPAGAPFPFTPGDAYDKNLTYRIGRCPSRSIMPLAAIVLKGIKARGIDPRRLLISHRFLLDDALEAYRLFDGRLDGCTKAVLYASQRDLDEAMA